MKFSSLLTSLLLVQFAAIFAYLFYGGNWPFGGESRLLLLPPAFFPFLYYLVRAFGLEGSERSKLLVLGFLGCFANIVLAYTLGESTGEWILG